MSKNWRNWPEVTKESQLLAQLRAAQSTDDLIDIGRSWSNSEVTTAWSKLSAEEQARLWGYSKAAR